MSTAKCQNPFVRCATFTTTNRDEAITKLKKREAELRALGVEHVYPFASTARGEAGEDSDIDLFSDHEKAASASTS
jgi:predicted nucleotidyltransferase